MSSARQAVSSDDMALDLGGLMRTLGGALRWLLPLVLIIGFGTLFALQFVAPKYKGEARILIESKDGYYPGAARGAEEERALLDTEGVESQVQLLMSKDLARRVAKRLDLAAIPEFEAASRSSVLSDVLGMLGVGNSGAGNSAEERVLQHYFKNLEIYRLEGSRVIAVEYTARSPQLAADVANTILDEYVSLQSSAKRATTEVAATALEPQIRELRQEVQAARKAVEDFRAHADLLVGADNLTLNQQQLVDISTQYSNAQASRAEAQAKADLIRELLNSGGSLETASDVLNSPLIQRLRERQVEIQSNIAELSITLLPNHPQLKALQSQLKDYNRLILAEARKVLIGLENDAKVSSQQAAALAARLNELKGEAARSNADQVRLAELEREADAKADQLDSLMTSFRDADTRLRAQVLPVDARIISRASIPAKPDSPKVLVITIVATLATFVLGAAFVIMREFLSGNALHPIDYGMAAAPAGLDPARHRAEDRRSVGSGSEYGEVVGGIRMTGSYSDFSTDWVPAPTAAERKQRTRQYVAEMAQGAEMDEINEVADVAPSRRTRQPAPAPDARYDQDVAPDWVAGKPVSPSAKAGKSAPQVDPDFLATVPGGTVVLSVDTGQVSHDLAFGLARQAADESLATVLVEIFPEQDNPAGAEGFSDLLAGDAVFSEVVYRDAGSRLHIIESGRLGIPDDLADSARFKSVISALYTTYDVVIFDLGTIDGSLTSARVLGIADRVLVSAEGEDYGQELISAANQLSRNTGAIVDVVPPEAARPGRRGPGRAA